MRRDSFSFSLLSFFLCCLLFVAPRADAFSVRVGISTGKSTLQIWSESGLIITDAAQPQRKLPIAPRQIVTFTKTAAPQQIAARGITLRGNVTIGLDKSTFPAWQVVNVRPLNWRQFIRVSSNGSSARWSRPYRGTFEITPQTYSFDPPRHQNPLRVVNVIDLEDYMKGVVPWEMKPSSPLEALKAQAICARSETLHNLQAKRFERDGYDICDYDRCQGYPGTENEKPSTTAAVEQTKGQILTYNGQVVNAVYGTNSGGITAASTDVWRGGDVPYLRNVYDYKTDSPTAKVVKSTMTEADWAIYCSTNLPSFAQPTDDDIRELAARRAKFSQVAALYQPGDLPSFYRWSRSISQAEALRALGPKITPRVNTISAWRVVERAASGHIKKLQIIGQWIENGVAKSTSAVVIEGDGAIRSVLSGQLGSTVALPSSTFTVITQYDKEKRPTSFVLKGAGWGHGVGMCQSGARAHAREGWSAKQILEWYYRDAKIESIS